MSERRAEHQALIAQLFPTLSPVASCEPVGDGWDNDTYEVNGEWIVQIPRTEANVRTQRAQIMLLPELVREVSAPVPFPEHVSLDPAAMAYRKIEGVSLLEGDPPQEGMLPERLGRFLYDLHMVPLEYLGLRGQGPGAWRARYVQELAHFREEVFPLLDAHERDRASTMFDAFLNEERNFSFPDALVHNDLGPAHILATPAGDLAGIIDWGDAAPGDPAIDFAWILMHAPELGERALAAYGGAPDPTFRERARFYARLSPWHELSFGLDAGQPAIIESGLASLNERPGDEHLNLGGSRPG
jgi:aminoglycoside phosphotransferase (APT) family kinase protein